MIDSTECAEKSRHKEDVAVRNVAPARSKNAADVVAKSVRTKRVVAPRESNLPLLRLDDEG